MEAVDRVIAPARFLSIAVMKEESILVGHPAARILIVAVRDRAGNTSKLELVVAAVGVHDVIAGSRNDRVVAVAGRDRVVTGSAVDPVVASIRVDDVVSVA